MGESAAIVYRSLTAIAELKTAVELQKVAWTQNTITPMPQLAAAILHGGLVLGAFDGEEMIGFCYGFPGYTDGHAYLASHMMAIDPDYRDRGIGMRLKVEQRLWAMDYGYDKIVWTYDPFETRNGYLNLCKLGGTVGRYIPSFYGTDSQGLPVDRFMVEWDLHSLRVEKALSKAVEQVNVGVDYPKLLAYESSDSHITAVRAKDVSEIGDSPGYLLPVPAQIRLREAQPELVATWQGHLRRLCMAAFSHGYRAVALLRRDGLHHDYLLERDR